MKVVVGEGAAAEVEAVGEEVAVEKEVAVPGPGGEGGGGGLAVVVLCSEQLMILTETSNRTGSVELQDLFPVYLYFLDCIDVCILLV